MCRTFHEKGHPFAARYPAPLPVAYSGGVSMLMPRGKRALDRMLDESYVRDLDSLSLGELRKRREETDREEAWLSYLRRMLHGRIDILESNDTIESDEGLNLDALVQSLSGQMGPGEHHVAPDVVESPGAGRRAVERLIARTALDDLGALTAEQFEQRMTDLHEMEREVSEVRTKLHEVQNALVSELAERYRRGDAAPDGLLKGRP